MRLSEEEYREISVIIDQYREAEVSLDKMQEKLESVLAEKERIENRLEDLRKREVSLFEVLENRYGKGRLDLLTMEYFTDGSA